MIDAALLVPDLTIIFDDLGRDELKADLAH